LGWGRWDSNPHGDFSPPAPKAGAFSNFATPPPELSGWGMSLLCLASWLRSGGSQTQESGCVQRWPRVASLQGKQNVCSRVIPCYRHISTARAELFSRKRPQRAENGPGFHTPHRALWKKWRPSTAPSGGQGRKLLAARRPDKSAARKVRRKLLRGLLVSSNAPRPLGPKRT
jgi:hypothetical protein